MSETAIITKIQRFAINDGPGFRTNVFLKGCNMKCRWCHNPETQSFEPEIFWKKRLCIQCGACLEACPNGAIRAPVPPEEANAEGSGYHKIIKEKCDGCLKCAEACGCGALETVGKQWSVDEVIREVRKDDLFYANSGGGMTISGGEPTIHKEFVFELLSAAKENKLHVCLDTSGLCPWDDLEPLAEKADIVLYDVKQIDPDSHVKLTGVSNDRILQNLARLCEKDTAIWVRILVIPEYSDSIDYHAKVRDFLTSLPRPVDRVDLLPFHNWCEDKYQWLGAPWPMRDFQAVDPMEIEFLSEIYAVGGLKVTVGGSGFEQ